MFNPGSRKRLADEDDEFRPVSRRRRVLIALLAIATASTVMLSVLGTPGGAVRGAAEAAAAASAVASSAAACVDSANQRCVGGKADVILLSAPAPANAPSAPR